MSTQMSARYRILMTRRAAADLEQIRDVIAKDSAQNAADFIAYILQAIDQLDALPHRYVVVAGQRDPRKAVRRMPVPP
jgi:plasmid stabilization system protein ParE